jgi:hypothetical protein
MFHIVQTVLSSPDAAQALAAAACTFLPWLFGWVIEHYND